MKDFVVYTAARLGVFAATYAIVAGLFLLATGGDDLMILWPLVIAAVLSSIASAYLLRGMRDRVAAGISARAERMSQRLEEARSKEDEEGWGV